MATTTTWRKATQLSVPRSVVNNKFAALPYVKMNGFPGRLSLRRSVDRLPQTTCRDPQGSGVRSWSRAAVAVKRLPGRWNYRKPCEHKARNIVTPKGQT